MHKEICMSETIESLTAERAAWIVREHRNVGWKKRNGYFEACWDAQQRGAILFLVSRDQEELLGWVKVVWRPDYAPFREAGIPEIQDLNVSLAHRRKGVATRLLDRAEAVIRERSPVAGIAVGLYESYGAAQRLYALRGYLPDGRGVAYLNQIIEAGREVKVDDDLVLHMTKRLGDQSAS
jgi:GNAT superfamily N-acetyltransferase